MGKSTLQTTDSQNLVKKHKKRKLQQVEDDPVEKRIKKRKKKNNKFNTLQENEISSTSEIEIKDEDVETSPSKFAKKEKKMMKVDLSILWKNYKKRSTPVVKVSGEWHRQLIREEERSDPTCPEVKYQLKTLAARIVKDDIEAYKKVDSKGGKSKSTQFKKHVMSYGTARDKLAAHVLRIMEAPVQSLSSLNLLIEMINTKSKGHFIEAMNAVKELFESTLLPSGHVARMFESHNFTMLHPLAVATQELALRQLVLWYYEEQLKTAYQRLIQQLTFISRDTVDKNKMAAVRTLIDLVQCHPRQEPNPALEAIVNKLGDPSRKVAAHAMYGLRTLLQRRRELKTDVVGLIEDLLFRTNISDKARFYALCFLKDIIFSQDDHKLAEKLVKLYFGFFKACTKKGEVDTRLMAALLRGLNRAYPYLSTDGNRSLDEQLDTLYKLVHLVNFSIATQALQLIYQVLGTREDHVSDRFYQSLYRKVQDPSFGNSSACSAFLNLVFKALCRDDCIKRIRAFIKRLVQTCQYLEPNIICGILYLISEVIKENPALKEIKTIQPIIQNNNDDDSDTEFYPDLDIDESGNITEDKKIPVEPSSNPEDPAEEEEDKKTLFTNSGASWVHRRNEKNRSNEYDPYHRNPNYCGAEHTVLWELQRIQEHFHPSVRLFAENIQLGKIVAYSGDPLLDFTFMRFLDRFVFKNPKKMADKKDAAGGDVLGRRSQYLPKGVRGIMVNSNDFRNLKEKEVPEDQLFFHRYFNNYKKAKPKVKDEDLSDDDIGDDEFDNYLSNMAGAADVVDDDDDDEDIDFASSATANPEDDDELLSDGEFDANMDTQDDQDDMPNKNESEEEDDDDGELDGDDWQDMDGSDNSDDEEAISFSDSDDEIVPKSKKGKLSSKNEKKKSKKIKMPAFADADDFAHLLEQNADDKNVAITSDAIINRDSSSAKQLKWETNRNEFMQGKNWKNKKQGRSNQSFGKFKKPNSFKKK